jgi:hypothetical protein
VVLDDVSVWDEWGFLPAALDVLGQAGIAVLIVSSRLPATADPTRWLHCAGTWWINSLDAADVTPIRDLLQARGVTADLPLGALPPGVSVVTANTAQGSITATVYTDLDRVSAVRAACGQEGLVRPVA